MSKLWITEYAALAVDSKGNIVAVGLEPAVDKQLLDYAGGAQLSAAFNERTNFIRVNTDANAHINIGPGTPTTATVAYPRMTAGATEYFGVKPGQKLSVLAGA